VLAGDAELFHAATQCAGVYVQNASRTVWAMNLAPCFLQHALNVLTHGLFHCQAVTARGMFFGNRDWSMVELRGEWKFSNFVEEKRSSVCLFKNTFLG